MGSRLTDAADLLVASAMPDMPVSFRDRFVEERYADSRWSEQTFLQDLQEAWIGERQPFAMVRIPQTSQFVLESVVAAAAVRVAARYELTPRATWLLCVSTRHSRLREASRHLGLGVRRTEDLSGEIRAAGIALRDVVNETMWVALRAAREVSVATEQASGVVPSRRRSTKLGVAAETGEQRCDSAFSADRPPRRR